MGNKREISKRKRNNARVYPLYKMFSWDLLCFYSIEFLFYTTTKHVNASQVLVINACYIIFRIMMQIPAVTITDILGKRNAIIIGNILVAIYLVVLMLAPGMIGIIIADFICSLGYDIKLIGETNLLYDSVSTRGGEGLYSKLDSKGGSWYFFLNGIMCMSAGYLFVFNNYLPIIVCLGLVIISIVLSFSFKDIYPSKIKNNKDEKDSNNFKIVLKEYSKDLRDSVKFIFRSKRLKSYIIFGAIFYGTIKAFDTYQSDLLVFEKVPAEQFSMIFAVLSILAGFSVILCRKVQRRFRNKTLTFISLSYMSACIIVGISTNVLKSDLVMPIILVMYAIMRMCSAMWYILEYKYLKNFSTEKQRNKIMFTYELIGGIVTSAIALFGSFMLKHIEIRKSFLLLGCIFLLIIIIALKYMKTRIGLKPKEYSKEDIEFIK